MTHRVVKLQGSLAPNRDFAYDGGNIRRTDLVAQGGATPPLQIGRLSPSCILVQRQHRMPVQHGLLRSAHCVWIFAGAYPGADTTPGGVVYVFHRTDEVRDGMFRLQSPPSWSPKQHTQLKLPGVGPSAKCVMRRVRSGIVFA